MPKREINFEIAQEIRVEWETKKYSQRQLSDKYGINQSSISKIVNYEIWNFPERQSPRERMYDEAEMDRMKVQKGFCECVELWRKALVA